MGEALTVKLYQHQQEGFDFAINSKYPGTLLWHEMGLGKTLTAIIILRAHQRKLRSGGATCPKIMVIMPKSLLHQWKAEVHRFAPDLTRDIIFLPYSQLKKATALVKYHDFRAIVFDESHYLKTQGTNRIQDLCDLLESIESSPGKFKNGRYIMLSGTPMMNHAGELYTSWALLTSHSPTDASAKMTDKIRYDKWKRSFTKIKMKSWTTRHGGVHYAQDKAEGAKNEHLLHQLINPVVHYRRASDCLDLPPVQEIEIDLELDDDTLLEEANIEKPEEYMAVLERLARAKSPHAIEWIKTFMRGSQEQLVVFSPYKFALYEIDRAFPKKCTFITGDVVNDRDRRDNTKAFQTGNARILLTTYKAGGVGLNLQNAHHSLYLGYPWTPGDIGQAMARTNRSGQQKRTLHYFMFSGENDSHIFGLIRGKENAIKSVENSLLNGLPQVRTSVDNLI